MCRTYRLTVCAGLTSYIIQGIWPFLSALSLKYVKKPLELADDLESFLYVLLWMAFRWHRHRCSVLGTTDSSADPAALADRNSDNENLSKLVSSFFFEDLQLEGGNVGGGDRKYFHIQDGNPPLSLAPWDEDSSSLSPLNSLTKELYSAINRHYMSLDYQDLQRFWVPLVSFGPESEDAPADTTANSEWLDEFPEHIALFQEDLQAQQVSVNQIMTSTSADRAVISSPATNATATKLGQRVLDTHTEMITIFSKYVRVAWPSSALKKTADQFLGLGRQELVGIATDSGTASSSERSWASAPQSGITRFSQPFVRKAHRQ